MVEYIEYPVCYTQFCPDVKEGIGEMRKKEEQLTNFLGKEASFDGQLTFQGTIEITGHVKGQISGKGSLIVGEGGRIEASVHVDSVFTNGEMRADIIADRMVKIHSSGKVFGNIQAPAVIIDEGGIFEGHGVINHPKDTDPKKSFLSGADKPMSEPAPPLGIIRGVVTGKPNSDRDKIHNVFNEMEIGKKTVPVKYAKITASCKGLDKRTTRTDAKGYYEFKDLEDGEWKVKFKAKGYEKEESVIKISGGGVYEENFE